MSKLTDSKSAIADTASHIKQLLNATASCMNSDQYRLRKRLHRTKKMKPELIDDQINKVEAAIISSQQRVLQRKNNVPLIEYPEELPVSDRREEIIEAITTNQVVVIAGETGSGKTTQLPKICLAAGRGIAGMIGHTQPRRIAARSVAHRIAEELNSEVGQAVGYKVRFSDHVNVNSYIKLMTDGILLAEIQSDRYLNNYDTIIIDEAHERSLNIDFLLGYLKRLLRKRPDLKLIITSATIDTERFAKHFNDAPIIEVSGRTYPVEVRYRPLLSQDENEQDRDMQQAILDAVDELSVIDRKGDILIFLPGERDIRDTAEALRKHHPPHTQILPLFSRQSAGEQNKVFQTSSRQRIILATNVAETSLTVPGIRFVVDPGYARISRYSYRSKVQRLPIEKVSQSSANQRKGRCGRLSEGVCIRLYAEEDFLARPEYTEPEIKRTNLASVILQMEYLKLGAIEEFPFIEAPDNRYINDGYKLLFELHAIDTNRQLSKTGVQLAKLPIDPRVGRMLIAAKKLNCVKEMLIITSAISCQDPRDRPLEHQQKADAAHENFQDEHSDFLFFINLWRAYQEKKKHLSNNKLRHYCRDHFLSFLRMKEWSDVYKQLHSLVSEMGWKSNQVDGEYDQIHQALLSGLLSNIGFKTDRFEYQGPRGVRYFIHPGSALHKKSPKWLMAAELVETTKLYARMVAKIEPQWVEKQADHLTKHHYFEPHWEKTRGQVAAFESVTLYGLAIVTKRKINFGPIDTKTAREIFIREGLASGQCRTNLPFYKKNQALITELEQLEAKTRRRDILVDIEQLYHFYDKALPPQVYDQGSLEAWAKKAPTEVINTLVLTENDLLRGGIGSANETQFPDSMLVNGIELPLRYRFEPGHPQDGVTVLVPSSCLNQIPAEPFQWLVPGMLRDKIIALIKSLPKSLRRSFVPVPNFADTFLNSDINSQAALLPQLSNHLKNITDVEIPGDAWNIERLDDNLRVNFDIIDGSNKLLGRGKDLQVLKQTLKSKITTEYASYDFSEYEKDDIVSWDFGDLPQVVDIKQGGVSIKAYPALVDNITSVSLRLLPDPAIARRDTKAGLRRLFMLGARQQIKYIYKNIPDIDKMCLCYSNIEPCQKFKDDIVIAIVNRCLFEKSADIRSKTEYEEANSTAQKAIISTMNEFASALERILTQYHQVKKQLGKNVALNQFAAITDIKEQLSFLIYPEFVLTTPHQWLLQLPRFIQAIEIRLQKLQHDLPSDQQRQKQIQPYWAAYKQQHKINAQKCEQDPAWQHFRWMLEEMRVSLFAQQLKTSQPVSLKRLAQLLHDLK